MLPKAPNLSVPAETEIGTAAFELDFADQHAACVPDIDTVPASTVHVAEDVAFDPVRRSGVCVGEYAAVGQIRSVVFPEHAVGVYRGGAAVVGVAVAVDEVGVCDVDRVFVWGEAETVRPAEPIGYYSDIASGGIEAVDELGENWFGTETLLVTVDGVCEPDGAIGMHHYVVWRVEGAGVVVVQQCRRLVWAFGFHVYEAGRFL